MRAAASTMPRPTTPGYYASHWRSLDYFNLYRLTLAAALVFTSLLFSDSDLFRPGADLAGLDKALCDAANAAKQARSPGSETATLGGKMWTCPKAVATPFVLMPGTTPGKAGGITFLLGAYQIGPYSDGPYQIALPQSVFRALLNPAYADEFAGAPVKAGDVTPKGG